MFQQVYESRPPQYAGHAATLQSLWGLLTVYDPTAYSEDRILGMTQAILPGLGGLNTYWFTWDAITGQFLNIAQISMSVFQLISLGGMVKTRSGLLYFLFNRAFIGNFVTPVQYPSGVFGGPFIFPPSGMGGPVMPAIDQWNDFYIDINYPTSYLLDIAKMTENRIIAQMEMPDNIVALCLEDETRCYVLCANRMLVLVDYYRQEVLGMGRVPASTSDYYSFYGFGAGIAMGWDTRMKRVLIWERVPDNPDGTSNSVVRGYKCVSQAVRLVNPIPLKYPRAGRIIPVMTQLVDDSNVGVGGGLIQATVTGSGSLASSLPMTDSVGKSIFQVSCLTTGSVKVDVEYDQ